MGAHRSIGMAALAAVLAAGCGGGQSGSAGSASQAQTLQAGDALITYSGQPKPQLTVSSSQVTVVGQAGATFSTVTLQPPPNLASTYLVFGRELNGQIVLEKGSYAGGGVAPLYENGYDASSPSISPYGTIAFQYLDAIQTVREDGTGLKSISYTGQDYSVLPAFSIDGSNRLGFIGTSGSNYAVYIGAGVGGGSATLLQTTTSSQQVVPYGLSWNAAGSQIVYCAVPTGNVTSNLFTTGTTSGTTPVDVTPISYQAGYSFTLPNWSPDGVNIVSEVLPPSSTDALAVTNLSTGSVNILTPSGLSDANGCFSPDGSKIAFYRTDAGGATPGIYTCDVDGENQQILFPDPTGAYSSEGISWSPFLPKETVVAASGSTFYHKAASGVLLSQDGSQFGSVVAFTAATPSSSAIQASAPTNGTAPLAFTLTADSITSIGYINSYFSAGTTLTLTSTPSVVVTIDAQTGQVDLVAPSSVAKPTSVKNTDGTVTYQATFKALYDGTGKNLAPNGASQLTVNPGTGKLVRWS